MIHSHFVKIPRNQQFKAFCAKLLTTAGFLVNSLIFRIFWVEVESNDEFAFAKSTVNNGHTLIRNFWKLIDVFRNEFHVSFKVCPFLVELASQQHAA